MTTEDHTASNTTFSEAETGQMPVDHGLQTPRADKGNANFAQVMKIPIDVQFVLGYTRISVEDLMQLAPQKTIATSAHLNDKIDVVANGRVVARGELVVVNEQSSQLGIVISEVVDGPHEPGRS